MDSYKTNFFPFSKTAYCDWPKSKGTSLQLSRHAPNRVPIRPFFYRRERASSTVTLSPVTIISFPSVSPTFNLNLFRMGRFSTFHLTQFRVTRHPVQRLFFFFNNFFIFVKREHQFNNPSPKIALPFCPVTVKFPANKEF